MTNRDSTPRRCASRAAHPTRARSGRRARRTPPRRPPPAVPTPDTGARSGSPGGGHGKCSAPMPRARRAVQQPLQAVTSQHHRLPAVALSTLGGGAVTGEQVAALPLRGDAGVGHRLQPGAPGWSCSASRHTGTRSRTRARLPSASTASRSPPHSGLLARCNAFFHRSPGRIPVCAC